MNILFCVKCVVGVVVSFFCRMAACGHSHSICLDCEGAMWVFGNNQFGQLGLGDKQNRTLPQEIKMIPPIISVSCGEYFTVCVDDIGDVWSFGRNDQGQLGLGTIADHVQPQKVLEMPRIRSVHCGGHHVICITRDFDVWSFGCNTKGQLGLGHNQNRLTPAKIPNASQIKKVACGKAHTLFLEQTGTGNIVLACGNNSCGQLGIGTKLQQSKLTPVLNFNDIVSIASGNYHSIFLDSKGNVFGTGNNENGELGLGHNLDQCSPVLIPELLGVKKIFCGYYFTMCIDSQGFLQGFGRNRQGQLGLGDNNPRLKPIRVNGIRNVCLVALGGYYTLFKDSNNKIWSCGYNDSGQLGLGDTVQRYSPQLMDSTYDRIIGLSTLGWRNLQKLVNWRDEETSTLRKIEESVRLLESYPDFPKLKNWKVKGPASEWGTWGHVNTYLQERVTKAKKAIVRETFIQDHKEQKVEQLQKEIQRTEKRLRELKEQLPNVIQDRKEHHLILEAAENTVKILIHLGDTARELVSNEKVLNAKFCDLWRKPLKEVTEEEIGVILWKMDLSQYHPLFLENHVNGEILGLADESILVDMGMKSRDACSLLYQKEMMMCSHYLDNIELTLDVDESVCSVCCQDSPEKTIEYLREYQIVLPERIVRTNEWTAPLLLFLSQFASEFNVSSVNDRISIKKAVQQWKEIHSAHLELLQVPKPDQSQLSHESPANPIEIVQEIKSNSDA